MDKGMKFSGILLIMLLPTFSVFAQTTNAVIKHFEKNNLEFDYPAGWKVTENRADNSESVELANDAKTVQLIVQWQLLTVLNCQFEGTRKQISQVLAERVATQIHATAPGENSWLRSQFGELPAQKIQLSGLSNNTPVTAYVYSLAVKHYFLNLVFLRADNDRGGDVAWDGVRNTLKVAAGGPFNSLGNRTKLIEGGVLNGKAIRLARPSYPTTARAAHVEGTVTIQVLIDESGNVIATCVLSGDPLLQDVSEDAARQSKFSPTKLSGQPVQVMGIIQYNFIAQ